MATFTFAEASTVIPNAFKLGKWSETLEQRVNLAWHPAFSSHEQPCCSSQSPCTVTEVKNDKEYCYVSKGWPLKIVCYDFFSELRCSKTMWIYSIQNGLISKRHDKGENIKYIECTNLK